MTQTAADPKPAASPAQGCLPTAGAKARSRHRIECRWGRDKDSGRLGALWREHK